jgi:hypothetical protein
MHWNGGFIGGKVTNRNHNFFIQVKCFYEKGPIKRSGVDALEVGIGFFAGDRVEDSPIFIKKTLGSWSIGWHC